MKSKFFSKAHWLAFWITFLIVEAVYFYTLAPSVTLEDSGEFITAAAHFGVPHPPGYPFWTMINWLFINLLPFGNIAWRANLCSSLFGAFSCGIVSLITAFLADKFCEAPPIRKHLPQNISVKLMSFLSGTIAGLSFGFLESLWSQSVITEVYSINAFLFSVILLSMLRWLYEPERLLWPVLTFFFFGVGLTNHQILVLFSPALLVLAAFVNWRILRDLLPYVLMPACTISFCTQNKLAILVTAVLYMTYAGLMVYKCRGSFDLSRVIFLAVTLPLPALAGYLAAESINDVSAFSTLANQIPMKWALFILIFVVWLQLLISFFGSWRVVLDYALTVASAIGFATENGYLIYVAVILYALFAGFVVYNNKRKSFGLTQILFLALSAVLALMGGVFASACLGEFSSFPMLAGLLSFKLALALLLLAAALQVPLALIDSDTFWRARPALLLIFAGLLGLGVYGYMPLASSTNPPMNWSYTRTLPGFVHSVTRGQYSSIKESRTPKDLIRQIQFYYANLVENYTLPVALLAVLALLGIFDCNFTEKKFVLVLMLGWFFLSLFLTYILNFTSEEQTLFVYRVFYITSHQIFSIWVGLGIVILFALVNQIKTIRSWLLALILVLVLALLAIGFNSPYFVYPAMLTGIFTFIIFVWCCFRFQFLRYCVFPLVLFLPAEIMVNNWGASGARNWGSEERGHDFGWMFGYDILRNLDRDAVLFGGTDQGRFVPTYMIFCESFAKPSQRYYKGRDFGRRDLYIITQNALADATYMDYIRDHYSDQRPKSYNFFERWLGRDKMYPVKTLKIPDRDRYDQIFEQVAEELAKQPESGVTIILERDGKQRVGAEGINAIFAINGGIAKEIFEANKGQHAFYVEESFPIQWMYPYLEPCGLIMKLNKNPIPKIPAEAVKKDMEFWVKYTQKLLSNPKFLDDIVAQRSFAKLRSAIGGLYAYRGMDREAEVAFLQAVVLFGGSPEACPRLIEIYVRQERFDEARSIASIWLENDPENKSVIEAIGNLSLVTRMAASRLPLTLKFQKNPADIPTFLDLSTVLMQLQRLDELDRVVSAYLNTKNPDSSVLQQTVRLYVNFKKTERLQKLLKAEAKKNPESYQNWYNLAVVCSLNLQSEEALAALKKAVRLNPNLKSYAAQDPNFNNIRAFSEFGKLTAVPPSKTEPENAVKR